MDWELLAVLLDGFIFYGILYSLSFFAVGSLKQCYIRKLCRYRRSKEKQGPACVICAYHHECARAVRSREYRKYSYWRRVVPEYAKELFDEVWEEEKARERAEGADR